MYINVYIFTYTYTYSCILKYTYVYKCLHIYIYIHESHHAQVTSPHVVHKHTSYLALWICTDYMKINVCISTYIYTSHGTYKHPLYHAL